MKYLLILMFLPVVCVGQEIELSGGYIPSAETRGDKVAVGTTIIDFKAKDGFYIGAAGLWIGDNQIGCRFSGVYEQLNLNTDAYGYLIGPSVSNQTVASFLTVQPAFAVMADINKINLTMSAGVPVRIPLQEGYKTSVGGQLRVGLGFMGALVTAGYELGLTNFIDVKLPNGRSSLQRKLSLVSVGVSLFPQRWIKPKKKDDTRLSDHP